eukprot:3131942-Amphidinium_carterae.1
MLTPPPPAPSQPAPRSWVPAGALQTHPRKHSTYRCTGQTFGEMQFAPKTLEVSTRCQIFVPRFTQDRSMTVLGISYQRTVHNVWVASFGLTSTGKPVTPPPPKPPPKPWLDSSCLA